MNSQIIPYNPTIIPNGPSTYQPTGIINFSTSRIDNIQLEFKTSEKGYDQHIRDFNDIPIKILYDYLRDEVQLPYYMVLDTLQEYNSILIKIDYFDYISTIPTYANYKINALFQIFLEINFPYYMILDLMEEVTQILYDKVLYNKENYTTKIWGRNLNILRMMDGACGLSYYN